MVYDNHYYPLQYMPNLGSNIFVISPNPAKTFKIPVINKTTKVKSKDVTGREIVAKGIYTIPSGSSFGKNHSYNSDDHAVEVMPT